MSKKLVCYFSGWCEIDTEDVSLTHTDSGETKTAKEWGATTEDFQEQFILESFDDLYHSANQMDMTQLDLEIQGDEW